MDTAIQKAQERVDYVSIDKEALRAYQMREMALSDYTSGINHAKREGLREGLREGKQEVARKMKESGEAKSRITMFTGLTSDEIEKL